MTDEHPIKTIRMTIHPDMFNVALRWAGVPDDVKVIEGAEPGELSIDSQRADSAATVGALLSAILKVYLSCRDLVPDLDADRSSCPECGTKNVELRNPLVGEGLPGIRCMSCGFEEASDA